MTSSARSKLALGHSDTIAKGASTKPSKKRIRNFTADDRAAHRLFEKNRRECFRERLFELARELPALADQNPHRLSKHVVLDESIARHKLLRSTCVDALQGIRALIRERDELLIELNTWRHAAGVDPRQPTVPEINIESLVNLEKEPHVNDLNPSPDHGSGSSYSDAGFNFVDDGHQEVVESAAIHVTGANSIDVIAPISVTASPPSRVDNGTSSEAIFLPTDPASQINFPNDSQLDSTTLLDSHCLPQAEKGLYMPPQSPRIDIDVSRMAEIQLENHAMYPVSSDIITQDSITSIDTLITPRDFDLGDLEFPVPITDTNFGEESLLQHNPSWLQ